MRAQRLPVVVVTVLAVLLALVGLAGAPAALAAGAAGAAGAGGAAASGGGAAALTVSAGQDSGCGVRTTGAIACWGDAAALLSPPAGQYLEVSQYADSACALAVDGHVACWGDHAVSPSPTATYVSVSAGAAGGCGVTSAGALSCWGAAPAAPPAGSFRTVATGRTAACGVRVDGTLACFGASVTGSVPTGLFTDVSVGPVDSYACALAVDASLRCFGADAGAPLPAALQPPSGSFLAVSVGAQHACAVATDGTAVCWGRDVAGETRAPADASFLQVSAGVATSCGLPADGHIRCWGTSAAADVPGQNFGHPGVAAGELGSCGVATDSSLVCWGFQFDAAPDVAVRTVATGLFDNCAVTLTGTVSCWGAAGAALEPPAGTRVTQVVAGDSFACGLLVGGALQCWGTGTGGALDIVGHEPAGAFVQLAAAEDEVCALRADGVPVCFGGAGVVAPAGPLVQLSLSSSGVCGVRGDRTAVCSSTADAIADAVPAGHVRSTVTTAHAACVVTIASTVSCWGDANADAGVIDQAPGDVTLAVLAGNSGHVCGVEPDGTGLCWGDDGQRKAEALPLVEHRQAITVGPAPTAAVVGGPVYVPVTQPGASANPVAVSVDPSSAGVCTVDVTGAVTFLAVGTCVVVLTEAGNADYAEAVTRQTFTVHADDGSIAFASAAPAAVVDGPTYTPVAIGVATDDPITMTVDPSTTGCTVDGAGVVSFVHADVCTVVAHQAGNPGLAVQSFAVGRGAQTITMTSDAPDAVVGGAPYTPTATGGRTGNPVTFTADPTATGCTVDPSGAVTFVHATTCALLAHQAGGTDYLPTTVSVQTFPVGPGTQTITFTSAAPHAGVGGADYRPAATGGASGRPVTFTAGNPLVCLVLAGTVVFVGEGTCSVTAHQAASSDWSAAEPVTQTFAVDKTPQPVLFSTPAPSAAVVGGAAYVPAATGGLSGNPVTFLVADPTGPCAVTGTTVTFRHAGICHLLALQLGDAIWADSSAEQQITVAPGSQQVTVTAAPATAVVGGTATVTATGGASGQPVTFAVDAAATPGACTVDPLTGVVTFRAVGTCVVDASQAGTADYTAAAPQSRSITVTRIPSTAVVTPGVTHPVFGQDVTATATISGATAGSVQFTVDGQPVGAPVAIVLGGATSPALRDAAGGPLDVGAHTVGADFVPTDAARYTTATAAATLDVEPAATATEISVGPATVTATVVVTAPGSGTPTGTAHFLLDGTTVLGDAPLVAGVATLSAVVPPGATRQVSVTYTGDGSFLPSGASTARQDPLLAATVTSSRARNAAGWYRAPVTVSFTCTAEGAPLIEPCPAPVVLGTDGRSLSVTRTIHATDGGQAMTTVGSIALDRTAPKVVVRGVRAGAVYPGVAPRPSCAATDATSGVAACTVKSRVSGTTTTYRVTATDRAGNTTVSTGSFQVLPYYVSGVTPVSGAFPVRLGHTYRVVAVTAKAPRFLAPVASPRRPQGRGLVMRRAAKVGGHPAWTATLVVSRSLRSHPYWNIGVLTSSGLHVLRLKVTR